MLHKNGGDDLFNLSNLNTILNGVTYAELERELGFGNGTIRRWEKSLPSVDKILKIAQYFNVTTDYLLTGADPPPKNLAADQQEVLALWDKLDREEQLEFKGELKGYVRAKEKRK
jgi:transcriptional regulator with XRE-family HTH domain